MAIRAGMIYMRPEIRESAPDFCKAVIFLLPFIYISRKNSEKHINKQNIAYPVNDPDLKNHSRDHEDNVCNQQCVI